MFTTRAELDAVAGVAELENAVAAVEQRLAGLAEAMRERDAVAIERQADHLHLVLAQAVQAFRRAARRGGVPDSMRLRLANAGAQVARQRELLARATAALDRAIDVLLPGNAANHRIYNATGHAEPEPRGPALSA